MAGDANQRSHPKQASRLKSAGGDELPATDISLGLWLSHSKKPVRLINAPEAFVRAGDGKACIRKPEALVCCHGSMGPRNMQRCGNSSWTAMPAVEAEMSALPQCRSKLPAPLDSRCRLGSGGEGLAHREACEPRQVATRSSS